MAGIFALVSLAGCGPKVKQGEVVAIEKTHTYHRENCPPTNMAKTKIMTVAEARSANYKPCPACKADSAK